ncbi:MAG: hypothetical protein ACI4WM_08175 [Erysipelotrichaceae bacterium]
MTQERIAGLIILIIGIVLTVRQDIVFIFKRNQKLTKFPGYSTLLRVILGAFIGVGLLLFLGVIA